jgi:hypothetical protein
MTDRDPQTGAAVPIPDPRPPLSRRRVRAAFALAIAADGLEFVLLPLTLAGAASPVEDALDLIVGVLMIALLGWHPAFLPSFLAKLIPFVDLAPTWTVAAWLVTRRRRVSD